jgi:hypothetical protein
LIVLLGFILKDITAEGGFAMGCLLASIIYAAAGDVTQSLFFFSFCIVFVVLDIRRSKDNE